MILSASQKAREGQSRAHPAIVDNATARRSDYRPWPIRPQIVDMAVAKLGTSRRNRSNSAVPNVETRMEGIDDVFMTAGDPGVHEN